MSRALIALLPVLGLLVAVGATAGPSQSVEPHERRKKGGSLSVSPSQFYQGEKIRFSGRMPRAGKQKIRLQFHMGRPGDSWTDLQRGNVGRTDRQGRFKFRYVAPAMKDIRYRVKSKSGASPSVLLAAKWQVMDLRADAGANGYAPDRKGDDQVRVGSPFVIRVDTTPEFTPMAPTKPLPGREITLQQRVSGTTWHNVATQRLDANGNTNFALTAPAAPGTRSYRTIAADWTKGGSKVGWDASFPYYVDFVTSVPPSPKGVKRAAERRSTLLTAIPEAAARKAGPTATAGRKYRWGLARYDFAWEQGESLTSKPFGGSKRKGKWTALSDGTGRVMSRNGELAVHSGYDNRDGHAAHGNTSVTMNGNPLKVGRWEFRMRTRSEQPGPGKYKVRIELVPEGAAPALCGGPSITVAEVTDGGKSLTIGADSKRANKSWSRTKSVNLPAESATFGVEVLKDHVTWFYQGKPVGSLKTKKVMGGAKLTPRLSVYDAGQPALADTIALFDWIRGYEDTKRAKVVKKGGRLNAGPLDTGC